jgi:hypothetical protein
MPRCWAAEIWRAKGTSATHVRLRERRSPTFSDGALKLRLNESYMGEDEVCFLELQSEEQPDMNGWYWTDQPGISDEPAGVVDVEGIHGPFKTKQEALDHYNFRRLQ